VTDDPTPPDPDPKGTRVELGVIEFHSERINSGLIERFHAVTEDLRDAACIVDVWLMDIAAVLKEHGYDMRIYRMHTRKDSPLDSPPPDEELIPNGDRRPLRERLRRVQPPERKKPPKPTPNPTEEKPAS